MASEDEVPSTITVESTNLSETESSVDQRIISTGSAFESTDTTIDNITRNLGFSQFASALTASMYGVDITGTGTPAQQMSDQYGLTFFTRPLLNLSYYNLKAYPDFTPMMQDNPKHIGSYVRAMLDPIGHHRCDLVDNNNPFIPILSNTLESFSGWPDPVVDTYTSPANKMRGEWSMIDSSNRVYRTYDLSATHRNLRGGALLYMFHVWQTYMSGVFSGELNPYPIMIRKNVIDYQSRAYRLVLDPSRVFVEDVIVCHAMFPLINPLGRRADFNRSEPMNKDLDLINQTWRAQGARYFNPISFAEFNKISEIFNPSFGDASLRKSNYRRLWPDEWRVFNYMAIPRINEKTSRLEWWVSNAQHQAIMGSSSSQYTGYNIDD